MSIDKVPAVELEGIDRQLWDVVVVGAGLPARFQHFRQRGRA